MSSSVSSRWVRSTMRPSLRASMNSASRPPVSVYAASAVPGQEPEADGYLRGVEELTGQGHHAVNHVRLDEVLPDFSLARLVR